MSEGVFKSVYAVSSEDPNHPATNLLKLQHGKKWKTRTAGEKSAYVVLQLDRFHEITGIDIGNEHSAFIEVLVGQSSSNPVDFKEILITCSFMTPPESKNSTNTNRVRCFSRDALVQPTSTENKWDLVKIICTQPFNKHVQYGLSFIKVYVAPEVKKQEEKKTSIPQLTNKNFGSFHLREESPDSESESTTSLFQRWKQSRKLETDPKISSAATIRDISAPSLLQKHHNSLKPSEIILKSENERNQPTNSRSVLDRNRSNLLYDAEDEISNDKLERKISSDRERLKNENEKLQMNAKKRKSEVEKNKDDSVEIRTKERKIEDKKSIENMKTKNKKTFEENNNSNAVHKKPTPHPSEKSPQRKEPKAVKVQQYKPFNKLLQGVTIVISGIQNPDRAEIRQKALEMGAKYKRDWDSTCTHLICAFKNTPKYNQVKGLGKIVSRSWIEKCYSLKKRLPWRRYALDDDEQKKLESEDEILDISLKPKDEDIEEKPKEMNSSNDNVTKENNQNVTMDVSSDESDTEDELEKVRNMKRISKDDKKNNSHPLDIYDVSTEEEDNTKSDKK